MENSHLRWRGVVELIMVLLLFLLLRSGGSKDRDRSLDNRNWDGSSDNIHRSWSEVCGDGGGGGGWISSDPIEQASA